MARKRQNKGKAGGKATTHANDLNAIANKTKLQAKRSARMAKKAKLSPDKLIAIYERQIKSSISTVEQMELKRRIAILQNGSKEEKKKLIRLVKANKPRRYKIRSSAPGKARERGRWSSIVDGGNTGLKK